MTPEEKQEFTTMKGDIKDIKVQMGTIGGQMTDCLRALLGSDIGKDGGLVGRIERMETSFKDFKEDDFHEFREEIKHEIQQLKDDAAKSRWHLNVIWLCCGAVAMSILGMVLKAIFKT